MNKKIKKGIIYTTGIGLLGGITSGIAVPIVIAQNRVNRYDVIDLKGDSQITDNLNVAQIEDALNTAGIEDKTLINKTEHATAFYLYDKEQKGSLNYQKTKFRYAQYTQLGNMFQTLATNSYKIENDKAVVNSNAMFDAKIALKANNLVETLKFNKTLVNDDGTANYDSYKTTFNELVVQIQANIDTLAKDSNSSDKHDSLVSTLKNYNDTWGNADTGLVSKIEKITSGFSDADYEEYWFTSRYPEILKITGTLSGSDGNWSGTGIYKNVAKAFMDVRYAFISGYATKTEGIAAWIKELTKKYDGATSEAEAIETMVYRQVRSKAHIGFSYKTIGTYTIKELLSGVYADTLGTAVKASITVDTAKSKLQYDKSTINNTKVKISQDPSLLNSGTKYFIKNTDKVFFFGTKSKVSSQENPGTSMLPTIVSDNKMMEVQNAIFGFKQGSTTLDAWSVSKDMLKNMLYTYEDYDTQTRKTNLAADQYEKIFTTGEDVLTADLISKHSLTTDSTQWKSGSLGYMPGLDATKMAPGFGLGMLASYSDIEGKGWFDAKAITSTPDLLKKLRDAIVNAFILVGNSEGLASLDKTAVDASIFTKDNQESINKFIDGLDDAKVKQYFGIAIRNVFNKLSTGAASADGIPQVFQISVDKANHSGIYAFYSLAYGLHIVKINTSEFDLQVKLSEGLQLDANKQNANEGTTNFTSLFSKNYSVINKIKDLLSIDEFKEILNKIKDYTPVGTDIATDVGNLIDGLLTASNLDKIQKSGWNKLGDYLIKQFDGQLINQDHSLDPEKIYDAIKSMGVK